MESHDSTHVIAATYVEMSPLERKAEEARVLQEEEAARRMEEDTQLEEDIPQQLEKRDDELATMETDHASQQWQC